MANCPAYRDVVVRGDDPVRPQAEVAVKLADHVADELTAPGVNEGGQ